MEEVNEKKGRLIDKIETDRQTGRQTDRQTDRQRQIDTSLYNLITFLATSQVLYIFSEHV